MQLTGCLGMCASFGVMFLVPLNSLTEGTGHRICAHNLSSEIKAWKKLSDLNAIRTQYRCIFLFAGVHVPLSCHTFRFELFGLLRYYLNNKTQQSFKMLTSNQPKKKLAREDQMCLFRLCCLFRFRYLEKKIRER